MTDQAEAEALQRRANATIAALTRAARTDGREISAPARAAFLKQFGIRHECKHCGVIEIDQSLPPDQRARAARAAMSAHFRRLAAASKLARFTVARIEAQASEVDEQLRADLAALDVE